MSDAGLNVITSSITGLISVFGTGPFGGVDLPAVNMNDIMGAGKPAWIAHVSTDDDKEITLLSETSSGLKITQYPKDFLNAVLAAEDGRFNEHAGADPIGVASAVVDSVSGKMRGGSTISQQLVKNSVVGNDMTAKRKISELILSVRMESAKEKSDILEAYLRHAWFGRGVNGAALAPMVWFGKGWDQLSLAENVTLAIMLKGPTRFDPEKNPELVKERRDAILSRMESYGWVSKDDADVARNSDVKVIKQVPNPAIDVWVASAIKRGVTDYISKDQVTTPDVKDIKLTSTINTQWQDLARGNVKEANLPQGAEAAMVIMSIPDGSLLASIGGVDPEKSGYDRTWAMRQPGSLSKPFFYGAALDYGLNPWTPVRNDRIDWGDGWDPRNYDMSETAEAPLYQGLEASSNLMTVHLADYVPLETMLGTAEMSGAWPLKGIQPFGPSLLGASETTLRRITSGLAGLVNHGETVPMRSFIEDVPVRHQFLSPSSSDYVIAMMRGVVKRGTAAVTGKSSKVEIVGKTGTSQNHRDAWFVALTPDIAVGVWVGRDDDKTLGDGETGGVVSSALAINVLNSALEKGLIKKNGSLTDDKLADATERPWPPKLIGDADEDAGTYAQTGTQPEGLPPVYGEAGMAADGLPPVFGSGEAQVDAFLNQVQNW